MEAKYIIRTTVAGDSSPYYAGGRSKWAAKQKDAARFSSRSAAIASFNNGNSFEHCSTDAAVRARVMRLAPNKRAVREVELVAALTEALNDLNEAVDAITLAANGPNRPFVTVAEETIVRLRLLIERVARKESQ